MLANAITSLRLVLAAPVLWLLCQAAPAERWAALALLALAGLTDVVDGRVARALGQVSKLGALLDLVADRVLTLAVLSGLIASGEVAGPFLAAAVLLIARDLVVASFGESAPGLGIRVTPLERVKITLQFAAFALLTAPPLLAVQYDVGRWCLVASAVLACVTVAGYARRVGKALE